MKRADTSFHVPGHKNGRMYAQTDSGPLGNAMKIDATEITGLDDLHHPEGVIREAQELAADYFGAEETHFLVGGSTVGNLALLLTVCTAPGDIILVQRNVHKSVIHGLMLARAQAVFLAPEIGGASGLATIPALQTVCEALRRYPGAKGVLITHPNYYGMGGELAALAEQCHAAGVPLLVDEAHGAHYGLAAELPPSALSQGADGVVQSTHKMLGALTMGAMLHVQGPLLDRPLLRQRLAMVQSSSPSYLVMASLDLCRGWLEREGRAAFAESLNAARKLKAALKQLKRIKMLDCTRQSENREQNGSSVFSRPASGGNNKGDIHPDHLHLHDMDNPVVHSYTSQDPFKAVLYDGEGKWSGYRLQEQLERHGCVPEMSDERYTVLALGPGTRIEDIDHLLGVLHSMEAEMVFDSAPNSGDDGITNIACVELSTWNNFEGEAVSEPTPFGLEPPVKEEIEMIELQQSEGRKAAEMVIPYPPGIPLLYPGEPIAAGVVQRLIALRNAGARFQGATDPSLCRLQVYKKQQDTGGRR